MFSACLCTFLSLEQVNRFVFADHFSGLKSHCTEMNAFCGSFETQYGAFIEDVCQFCLNWNHIKCRCGLA